MKETLLGKFLFSAIIFGFLLGGQAFAQQNSNQSIKRNSPFSPNPKKKAQPAAPQNVKTETAANTEKVVNIDTKEKPQTETKQPENKVQPKDDNTQFQNAAFDSPSIAKKT